MAVVFNVSPTPSAKWSTSQVSEAIKLVGGDWEAWMEDDPEFKLADCIRDVPMPEVDPRAEIHEIDGMCEKILDVLIPLVIDLGGVVAVEGDFTLAYCLYTQLQLSGIACYVATNELVETGGTKTFQFVQFRPL